MQVVSAVLIAEREEQGPGVIYLGPRAVCQVPGVEVYAPNAGGCPVQPTDHGPLLEDNELQLASEPPSTAGRKRPPIQHPVYFISSVLRDAREWYPEI